MAYKLWLKQDGQGCDYTIGCANELFDLKAKDKDKAIKESSKIIKENTHEECTFETALLLEVVEDITHVCEEVVSEQAEEEQEEIKNEKRKQLKKLKEELGEN